MVCPICAICAVPVLLLGISGAGVLQHLPLPSDAVMRQRGCQPFLAPFKLDLPCLTDLLPAGNCLPDLTATAIGPFWVLDAGSISSIWFWQLWS